MAGRHRTAREPGSIYLSIAIVLVVLAWRPIVLSDQQSAPAVRSNLVPGASALEVELQRLRDLSGFDSKPKGDNLPPPLRFPLRLVDEAETVTRIAANPFFARALESVAALSKADAATVISRKLSTALVEYKTLYDKFLAESAPARIFNLPWDVNPELKGLRLQILSLLLVAGNCELSGAAPAVREVASLAMKQRAHLHRPDAGGSEMTRAFVLRDVSLFNRVALATAADGVIDPAQGFKRTPLQPSHAWVITSAVDETISELYGPRVARAVSGSVILPSGAAAKHARIALGSFDCPVQVLNGSPVQQSGLEMVQCDAEGRFSIVLTRSPIAIYAFHVEGFGCVDRDELAKEKNISIRAWGRIDGVAAGWKSEQLTTTHLGVIRSKPMGASASISDRAVHFVYDTTIGNDGRFSISVIPPDMEFKVGRLRRPVVIEADRIATPLMMEPTTMIALDPGETLAVRLNFAGHRVIGRISAQPETLARLTRTPFGIETRPPAAHRSYPFRVAADGTFEIENVESGDYILKMVTPRDKLESVPGALAVGAILEFSVAEVDVGVEHETLDLGTVQYKRRE